MDTMICKKDLVLFIFPHRRYVLDIQPQCLSEAILTNIQNICCLKFNAILLHISHQLSPLERRVRDIQIVIETNFVSSFQQYFVAFW